MHASNGGGDDDDDDDDYWVTTTDWKTVWLKEVAIYVIIALGCQRGEGLMHSFKHVQWGHKRVHTLCVRQVLAIPLNEKCISRDKKGTLYDKKGISWDEKGTYKLTPPTPPPPSSSLPERSFLRILDKNKKLRNQKFSKGHFLISASDILMLNLPKRQLGTEKLI